MGSTSRYTEHRAKTLHYTTVRALSPESRCKTSTRSWAHGHFLKLLMSLLHRKPRHRINHLQGVTLSQRGANLSAGKKPRWAGSVLRQCCSDLHPLAALSSLTVRQVRADRSTARGTQTYPGIVRLWCCGRNVGREQPKGFRRFGTGGWPVVRQSISSCNCRWEAER